MEIETDDYIVIAISREKDAETAFLKKAGRANTENWCYSAMGSNCENKTISKPCDLEINNNQVCYSFYLINAYCWKCHVMHQAECSCSNNRKPSEKIKKLLENIKKNGKKIIVWTHSADDIPCNEIKELFDDKLSFCDSFSHVTPNHIVEDFMLKVCKNGHDNFQEEFKKLIEASLKKIALSILHLHLFLPLDIDMQALEILFKEGKEAEAASYFREMLTESKPYHKRIINDAEELLNQISDEKKKAEVKTSLDKISGFLKNLKELQSDQISDFNIDQNKELKEGVENFHGWYCALDKCLRGEKACKD